MLYFMHFMHTTELGCLVRYMYTMIGNERVKEMRIDQVFFAVLFKKEFDGLDSAKHEQSKEMAKYYNICLLHNRFTGVPVCVVDSMTLRIVDKKIYIKSVTFDVGMIQQVVEYVCGAANWPRHMTEDDKLAAAITDYSMRSMDSFMANEPRTRGEPATWIVYELPMLQHAFLTYMVKIYLVGAADIGALDSVKAFFAAFPRGDGDMFDVTKSYGMCEALLMLDGDIVPNIDSAIVDKQLDWVIDLLVDLLGVPEL